MDCIDKLDDILRKFHLGQYTEIRLNNELLMLLRAVQMAQIKECAKNARIKKYVKVGTRQDELKYAKSFNDGVIGFPTIFEIDEKAILETKIIRYY